MLKKLLLTAVFLIAMFSLASAQSFTPISERVANGTAQNLFGGEVAGNGNYLVGASDYYDELVSLFEQEKIEKLRLLVAVLIDGPYIDELNYDDLGLRGSSNQNLIFFNEDVRDKYEGVLGLMKFFLIFIAPYLIF